MAWRRLGDKPLSEPMMISLPMHICVTRPQWVNLCLDHDSPCVKVLITPYIPNLFLIKKNTHEPFIPTHSNILPYHMPSRMVTFDPLCADTLGWHREAPSYDYVIRKPVNHPRICQQGVSKTVNPFKQLYFMNQSTYLQKLDWNGKLRP